MNYENVKLWFAHKDGNIVTIDEINEENKNDSYSCPVCGSELKPKAIKSKQVSSHFAHIDSSKCNSETMIHWWFKHKFLEVGDKFTVVSNKEKQYIVKEVKVEQSYQVLDIEYKPDVTINTECGKTIYFEMAFSNKKKVKDYLDIWLELKNIVVEIDIKQLMSRNETSIFKALFYDGKCFNTKRNDTYYNTIGKYKEEKLRGKVDDETKERIRKLDWFWEDVIKYQHGQINIEDIANLIDAIEFDDKKIVDDVLNRKSCVNVLEDYYNHKEKVMSKKLDIVFKNVSEYLKERLGAQCLTYLNKNICRHNGHVKGNVVIKAFYPIGKTRFIYCRYNGYSKGGKVDKFNIEEYNQGDLNDVILSKMKDNLEYINSDLLKEQYEEKAKVIKTAIINNESYKTILNLIRNKNINYNLSLDVDSGVNGETGIISVGLTLKFENNDVVKISKIMDRESDVDDLCNNFYWGIHNYLEKVVPISIEDIEHLFNGIKDRYSKIGIKLNKKQISEDAYRFCFYSKSGGYIYSFEINSSANSDQKLKEELTGKLGSCNYSFFGEKCKDCNERFSISINEVMFFADKNLNVPKRCKSCRVKRKHSGGIK